MYCDIFQVVLNSRTLLAKANIYTAVLNCVFGRSLFLLSGKTKATDFQSIIAICLNEQLSYFHNSQPFTFKLSTVSLECLITKVSTTFNYLIRPLRTTRVVIRQICSQLYPTSPWKSYAVTYRTL